LKCRLAEEQKSHHSSLDQGIGDEGPKAVDILSKEQFDSFEQIKYEQGIRWDASSFKVAAVFQ
jgi:hypothetical protein